MGRRFIPLLVFVLTLIVVGLGLWGLTERPELVSQTLTELGLRRQSRSSPLVASGFVEAQEVSVSSEVGGRVVSLMVEEGETVAAGQLLLALDGTLLEAQIEAAVAALEVARAREHQIAAGAGEERLRVAQAEVARARAARDAAYEAWQQAMVLRDNPQELRVEIAAARAGLQVAEQQLAQAEALRDAAAVGLERFDDVMGQIGPTQRVEVASGPLTALAPLLQQILPAEVYQALMSGQDGTYRGGGYEVVVAGGFARVYQAIGLQMEFHLLPNTYWQAGTAVNVAQAVRDGARATLNHLYAVSADPQAAAAQVDAAHSAYAAAQAGLEVAQAGLETLRAGASQQELGLARSQVAQAEAALATLETQRTRMHLSAPRSGVVTQKFVAPGELVVPGVPVLTIADLSRVTLTVYVPVDELRRVRVGQQVAVRVDAFAGRTFQGAVMRVADEAEFTPSVTQTDKERVNLVFAVEVRLLNPEGALKPGLPADAVFEWDAD